MSTVEHQGKCLITVRIEESPIKPVWAFGRPIKRVGRANHYLRRDEAQRLMAMTTGRTWDALPCQTMAKKDIDRTAVKEYLHRTGMKVSTSLDDLLKNLNMPRSNSYFCNGTVLLFGKHPQSFLLESEVKCGRFAGTQSVNFLDERTLEGNIITQLEEALAFVKRNTRQAIRIMGKPERDVVPEYPEEAVREAIVNALCHRDYAAVGTIQVRIYDDRLEVWNPGHLPSDLKIKDLYRPHASHPRNPRLAHALYRARLIEHWGTGTLRIVEACKGYDIDSSFCCETGYFITRLIKKMPAGTTTKKSVVGLRAESRAESMRERIIHALGSSPRSPAQLARALGIGLVSGALKRSIRDLLKSGQIEHTIPEKPNSRLQKYRLCASCKRGHRKSKKD